MKRKMTNREFDQVVQRAIRRIPEEIRKHLKNIMISVQDRPSPDILDEMGYPPDEALFGLYYGTSLLERSLNEPPLYPDTIFIYQEPLEEFCETLEELEEEIEITVVHEIAHYLGMDEDWLIELGYE
ncbi:MAG TPA: metallopeptidase family protein [Syntrophales bacterium]|nr:metallopeptidase family protein [Syntrophales bacterium]